MEIHDKEIGDALRTLLQMPLGFCVDFFEMLEIGQLENLNYWVTSRNWKGNELWHKDDIPLEEAIGHFLRIRRELELGYDFEVDLSGHKGHGDSGPRSDS